MIIENNTILLLAIIIIIIVAAISIRNIKKKVSEPFDYIVQQIENNKTIDKSYLYKNFEYEKVSQLYDTIRAVQLDIEQKNMNLESNNKEFILSSIHQLKTPLSAILMNVELLQMGEVLKEQKEFISEIQLAANTLTANAEELAYLSMADDIKYTKEDLNISDILRSRVEYFQNIATNKEIKISIDDNIYYNINRLELERLIDNNISNCVKYSTVDNIIFVSLIEDNGKIVLEFKNSVEMINQPEKLFDKGYRESDDRDGYGFGLYIVKSICDKYNIDIDMQNDNKQIIFRYVMV